ncbi:hypothetical protein [Nocardia sp. SYP-A9097]|uniref:hypothetical protein n=1 Tax=Nocardia sp. SYP-A9097 TaxID=2663237 RepID=UPI00129B9787|nr:hypothetical protein [Nocardia sp. SYP-A9097]
MTNADIDADLTDVHFAFYGDLLAQLVDEVENSLPADISARSADDGPSDYATTQRAIWKELTETAGLTDDQIHTELGTTIPRDPQNWGWVLACTRALSRIPDLDTKLIDRWVRDVSLYLTNTAVQRAINKVVLAELDDAPFVLVAHSLGTVLSYNVLRSADRHGHCHGLITLGSPLGISAIRTRLHTPLTHPRDTDHWFNAYDKADIVALRPLDQDWFPLEPPIENYEKVSNTTSNHHGISGYLNDPFVAATIAKFLHA